MKRVAFLSTLVITGSLLLAAPAQAVSCEDIYLESYQVDVKIGADTYDLGDRARIAVTVTRLDTGEPVEDADVGIALAQEGDYVQVAMKSTGARGRAVFTPILRAKRFDPGPVDVNIYAWQTSLDTVCLRITEYGHEEIPEAFRIRG